MSFLKSLKDGISLNVMWVFLVSGVLLLIASIIWIDEQNVLFKIGYTIGTTFIASGVFAAIAKSSQFAEIFSKILRDIVYSNEHLKSRKDLEQIWKNVTATLSNEKFDKISESLQNNIKKYFLPLDHDYYYDEYNLDITIEYNKDDSNYIDVKEVATYKLVCEDEGLNIKHNSKCRLKCDYLKQQSTTYNLTKLHFNGVDVLKQVKTTSFYKDNELFYEAEHQLSGKRTHTVLREDVKTYDLRYNKIKSHRANWIYNKFNIQIFYPQSLKLDFQNLGTLYDYDITVRHSNGNSILKAKNNGILYKNQGFIIIYN